MKCLSLIADEDNLRKRLTADVACGIRTVDVIERSLERIGLYRELDTIKIDTSGKTVAEIVEEIRAL